MKQFYTIVFLIVVSMFSTKIGTAQITYSTNSAEYVNQPKDNAIHKAYDTFYNAAKSIDTLYWKVVYYELPTGWTAQGICDNSSSTTIGTCYSLTSSSTHKTVIDGEGKNEIYSDITATTAAVSGCAIIRIVVNGTGIPLNTPITFIHTDLPSVAAACKALGVSEHNFIEAKLVPNPVSNGLHVNFNDYENLNVIFYDMYGKIVYAQDITRNSNYVDISNFAKGLYVAKLVNSNKQVVYAQKIVKE